MYVLHNPCVIFHVVDYMKTWIKDLNYISEVYFVIQFRGLSYLINTRTVLKIYMLLNQHL